MNEQKTDWGFEIPFTVAVVLAFYMLLTCAGANAQYRSYGGNIVDPQTGVSIHALRGQARSRALQNAVDEGGAFLVPRPEATLFQNNNHFDDVIQPRELIDESNSLDNYYGF